MEFFEQFRKKREFRKALRRKRINFLMGIEDDDIVIPDFVDNALIEQRSRARLEIIDKKTLSHKVEPLRPEIKKLTRKKHLKVRVA